MKRFTEQFKKKSQSIFLTTSEKDALRSRLSSYMEYHPLPVSVKSSVSNKGTRSSFEPYIEWAIPSKYYRSLTAGLAILIIMVVPILAERAIPGDFLYAMKVGVNEEVRSSLTSSGYEKVAWETQRLERRIAEARLLAKEGRLTEEVQAGVIAAVAEHQEATEAEIAVLRTTDSEAAALAELTFVSVLDVQSAALMADTTGSTTEGMSTVALASALDQAQMEVASVSDDEISFDRLVAQLEIETTRGRELLAAIKDSATEQEYFDLQRRLGDIERKVEGGLSLRNADTIAATEALKATWRDVQVIITFMTDIDVRTVLAIETMVPVVLTPEEERALALAAYTESVNDMVTINNILPLVTDGNVATKVSQTLTKVVFLLETASSTLDSDIVTAKAAALEARDYTKSIVALAEFNNPQDEAAILAAKALAEEAIAASSTGTTTDTVEETVTDEVSTEEDVEIE